MTHAQIIDMLRVDLDPDDVDEAFLGGGCAPNQAASVWVELRFKDGSHKRWEAVCDADYTPRTWYSAP